MLSRVLASNLRYMSVNPLPHVAAVASAAIKVDLFGTSKRSSSTDDNKQDNSNDDEQKHDKLAVDVKQDQQMSTDNEQVPIVASEVFNCHFVDK